jgi:ABC-type transporter MlaC component
MNKINKAFCSRMIAVLLCSFFAVTTSFAAANPVSELNSIADQLISRLKENKTTLKDDPSLVYSIANEVVSGGVHRLHNVAVLKVHSLRC